MSVPYLANISSYENSRVKGQPWLASIVQLLQAIRVVIVEAPCAPYPAAQRYGSDHNLQRLTRLTQAEPYSLETYIGQAPPPAHDRIDIHVMPDSPVDSGYRWAVVTPEDRSGIVYIVVFLSFTYSSITFLTRLFIKWHILGLDDGAITIAQIASLVQFGLVLASLSAGLAKNFDSLTNNEYMRMVSTQYGNQIALYLSLGFSKISTILLTRRLFTRDMKMAWLLCQVVSVVVVLWTIVAPFLVSVGCSPASLAPATPSATCPNIVNRYRILVITDAITDVILVVIPASLCWQLQMSVALKLQVFAVFAFRLPLVVLSALFLKTWQSSLSSTDPGVSRSSAIVFQQAELCLSLMAATIPCLKSFIRSFDTGSGVKASFGSSNGYGRGSQNDNGRTQSYKMSTMNRSKMSVSRSESQTRLKNDDEDGRQNRSFTSGRMSPPTTTRNKSHRDVDRESQIGGPELFIRRDMQFEVKSEHSHDPSSAVFRGMPL